MLDAIRVVLVNTSHPGNIGSAARAMKTMGLSELYLVSPHLFPHSKATEMASGANSVLEKAHCVDTLDEAIADCHLVYGTSARERTIPWPTMTPRECAASCNEQASTTKIAIVFGREQSGLTNEELHRCHYHIHIPSNEEYNSLNLAAAVQIICYELRLGLNGSAQANSWDYDYATSKELEGFYSHLEKTLIALDFLNVKAPRQLMTRLRRLFHRARLDKMEVNILRGILKTMEKSR